VIRVVGALAFGFVACAFSFLAALGWFAILDQGRLAAVPVLAALLILIWAVERLSPRPRLVIGGVDLLSPALAGERFVGFLAVFALAGIANGLWG